MSEFQFTAQDVFKTSSVPRNCARLLPISSKSKLNRMALGDDQGTIQILDFSVEQTVVESKNQSTNQVIMEFIKLKREISMIDLAPQPSGEKDRIFYSQGGVIIALTKKLKEFLRYDTQLADIIKYIVVEGNNIYTAGDYMVNHYNMINDQVSHQSFFMSPDKITDMQVHYISGQNKINTILACQDSCIRVLLGDEIQYEFLVSAPVICMHVFAPDYKDISSNKRSEQRKCFVYGLQNGEIIVADMTLVNAVVLFQFSLEVGISCLKPCDFFKTGQTDLLVGRSDGLVELYSFEGSPCLRATKTFNESITSIETGQFRSQNCEFIVTTFSGRVILLREPDENFRRGFDSKRDEKKIQKEQELKLKQIKNEISKLEQQLDEQQQKGSLSSQQLKQFIRMIHKFVMLTHSKQIVSQPRMNKMDPILGLQRARQQLKLQHSTVDTSIVSYINKEKSTECMFYLKDLNINIFEIKFRYREGNQATINAFVIPNSTPQTAQMVTIEIKSLSSHSKISNDINIKSIPLNSLNIKGQFTRSYMTMWINSLISDIPNQLDDTVVLQFKNIFTGTLLQIKYKQGQAIIKSDSVVAINICKQFIVEQANQRAIQIDVKWDINDETIHHNIKNLNNKILQQAKVIQQYKILPGLKEFKSQESDLSFLSQEFQEVLENEYMIIKNYQKLPMSLEFLIIIIQDIYTSRCILKGLKPQQNKLIQIKQMISNFQTDGIAQYIISG